MKIVGASDQTLLGSMSHHVGELLPDHDRRRVCIAGDDRRHDRGIGDAKSFDSMDFQLRIDDRGDLALVLPATVGDQAAPRMMVPMICVTFVSLTTALNLSVVL